MQLQVRTATYQDIRVFASDKSTAFLYFVQVKQLANKCSGLKVQYLPENIVKWQYKVAETGETQISKLYLAALF